MIDVADTQPAPPLPAPVGAFSTDTGRLTWTAGAGGVGAGWVGSEVTAPAGETTASDIPTPTARRCVWAEARPLRGVVPTATADELTVDRVRDLATVEETLAAMAAELAAMAAELADLDDSEDEE